MIDGILAEIRRSWVELILILAAAATVLSEDRLPYRKYWPAAVPVLLFMAGSAIRRLGAGRRFVARLRTPYLLRILAEDL